MGKIKQALDIKDQHKLIIAIGDFVAKREGAVSFEKLTDVEKYVSSVYFYEAEVNNGGLDQFFFNSTGDRWKYTLEGLRKIGANNAYRILTEAAKLFGEKGPSEEWTKRQEQMQHLATTADYRSREKQLTDEFYKYKDNLTELIINFVKSHANEFGET